MFSRNNPTGLIYINRLCPLTGVWTVSRFLVCYMQLSLLPYKGICADFFFNILFQCALRSFIRKGQTFSTFKIFTLLLMIAINFWFCTIGFIRLQKTLFVYLSLSLFTSPLFQGRGAEKCQLTCKPNVQLFEFEKNRKQNIILCVHFHMCWN